jgi:DNA-directed RNA polymerase sigma subunit (sigma70/sigma32)
MTMQDFTLTILQTLTPYEAHILWNRFGLSGRMASIGSVRADDQGLAGEDVQGIETRSLRKLRRAIDSHARLCSPYRV